MNESMTRSMNRLALAYHEYLSVVYLLFCTQVYLSVCKLSAVYVLICLFIILCMCACLCVCMCVGLSAWLSVYRSVWTRSVSIGQSVRQSAGPSRSVILSMCLFACFCLSQSICHLLPRVRWLRSIRWLGWLAS